MYIQKKNSMGYNIISWIFAIIDIALIGLNVYILIIIYASDESISVNSELFDLTILALGGLLAWNFIFMFYNFIKRKKLNGEIGFSALQGCFFTFFVILNALSSLITFNCYNEAKQSEDSCDQCFSGIFYLLILPVPVILNIIWGLVMSIMAFVTRKPKKR